MTQQEAEALVRILKNRNAEEKTSIENVYNADHHRMEQDRNHTMRRIEERITNARIAMSVAADKKHQARGKEDWKVRVVEYEEKRAEFVSTQRELSEMNIYYQGVFRELRNKRDYNYRRLAQQYAKEYAEIMSKVENPEKEEKVSYWKNKYKALKEEMKKLQEEKAA